jgi:hypothetical protein
MQSVFVNCRRQLLNVTIHGSTENVHGGSEYTYIHGLVYGKKTMSEILLCEC